jgi:hypothetical protein
MTSILDQFLPTSAAFRPKTSSELFALRLAQKLDDGDAVRHYVALSAEYPQARLLAAYQQTARSPGGLSLGRRFHVELERYRGQTANGYHSNLAALRVERRAIAVAIFSGDHLEYTQVRQLASMKDKALSSAVGFVNWIVDQFIVDAAALEAIDDNPEVLRSAVSRAVAQALAQHVLPIQRVSKAQLLSAYGQPPLRSRRELREVVTDIWPVLIGNKGQPFIQDAAALGLYVQSERHFHH